jgi:hypothetical protein
MPAFDTSVVVANLLDTARLAVSDEEMARFVSDYPLLRGAADALYLPELEFVEPALAFNPQDYYQSN